MSPVLQAFWFAIAGKSKGGSNGSVLFKNSSESEIPDTMQLKLILYSCLILIIVKTINRSFYWNTLSIFSFFFWHENIQLWGDINLLPYYYEPPAYMIVLIPTSQLAMTELSLHSHVLHHRTWALKRGVSSVTICCKMLPPPGPVST